MKDHFELSDSDALCIDALVLRGEGYQNRAWLSLVDHRCGGSAIHAFSKSKPRMFAKLFRRQRWKSDLGRAPKALRRPVQAGMRFTEQTSALLRASLFHKYRSHDPTTHLPSYLTFRNSNNRLGRLVAYLLIRTPRKATLPRTTHSDSHINYAA